MSVLFIYLAVLEIQPRYVSTLPQSYTPNPALCLMLFPQEGLSTDLPKVNIQVMLALETSF